MCRLRAREMLAEACGYSSCGKMKLKIWFLETRPQFLTLSVVLVFLGTCTAWYYDDAFHLGHALLAFVGLLLAHISANTLNDYFDYKSGIDLRLKEHPSAGVVAYSLQLFSNRGRSSGWEWALSC